MCRPLYVDRNPDATGEAQSNMRPDESVTEPATRGTVPGQPYLPYPGYDGNPND